MDGRKIEIFGADIGEMEVWGIYGGNLQWNGLLVIWSRKENG